MSCFSPVVSVIFHNYFLITSLCVLFWSLLFMCNYIYHRLYHDWFLPNIHFTLSISYHRCCVSICFEKEVFMENALGLDYQVRTAYPVDHKLNSTSSHLTSKIITTKWLQQKWSRLETSMLVEKTKTKRWNI